MNFGSGSSNVIMEFSPLVQVEIRDGDVVRLGLDFGPDGVNAVADVADDALGIDPDWDAGLAGKVAIMRCDAIRDEGSRVSCWAPHIRNPPSFFNREHSFLSVMNLVRSLYFVISDLPDR